MQQIPNYGDNRTLAFCAFCGGTTDTRDHCPSKVFLDEPYPTNLPWVPACLVCNTGFSKDEEYLACLISCVVAGSTDPNLLFREKTRRILQAKPKLRALLQAACSESLGKTTFTIKPDRVTSVLKKLAQGHALYELHETCIRAPDRFEFAPLDLLSQKQREHFEKPAASTVWPEVGSRAMQRLVVANAFVSSPAWLEVQPDRYRFLASLGEGIEVRIVINEYLACFVQWK